MNFIGSTVNWGIIGCGEVCEVKSGPAFYSVPNSKLMAVMRRNAAKSEDFALRHNVPKFYTSAEELINDNDVNAVYIATPPDSHELFTLQSIRAGKPVYVEKPISLNSESCKRMIEASVNNNIPVSCAHYRRALPMFNKIRELIEAKTIGRIQTIRINMIQSVSRNIISSSNTYWRVNPAISGGGLFHDLAPHQLDILIWLFGKPSYIHGHSINQSKLYDAPDLTSVEAVFRDDVFLNGIWHFSAPDDEIDDSCIILGEMGSIKFSFFRNPIIEIKLGKEISRIECEIPLHIQQPMIEKVVRYFKGEGPNPCSLEEALVSLQMMDATAE